MPPDQKKSGQQDEGIALIVSVRILQFLIIVLLFVVTSYFGKSCSCFDPSGIHGRSAAGSRRS